MKPAIWSAVVLSCLPALLAAADWPHWRGPGHNGVSDEPDPPLRWSQQENVTWKLAMPDVSGSTPIISGESIFLSVADAGQLYLWCVDRGSGKVKWKSPMDSADRKVRKGNMSSPSPVTDGKFVWLLTGTGVVKKFDFAGKEHWRRDLQKDYGPFGLNHGYGSSPVLWEGGLFIQVLHGYTTDDPSYLLKLDAATGKNLWRVERPTDAKHESPDSYTTPAILRHNKTTQVVVTGGDYVTGHDAATGKEIWRGGGLNPQGNPANRMIASPLVWGDMIYVPSRVRPLQAFRAGGTADISKSHLAWATDNGPDVPTPVTDGKYLYIVNDRGIVWVHDARTGAEVYGGKRIRPAIYSSSPVIAAGRIYISNEEGLTTVLKAGPDFEVLAENPLEDYMLSSPALSDSQIFLRTRHWLYCIGKRVKR